MLSAEEAALLADHENHWYVNDAEGGGYILHVNPRVPDAVLTMAIAALLGSNTELYLVETSEPDEQDWDTWLLTLDAPAKGHDLVTDALSSCVTSKSEPSSTYASDAGHTTPPPELLADEPTADLRRAVPLRADREDPVTP